VRKYSTGHFIRRSVVRKLLAWSSERTSDFVSKSVKTATGTRSPWKCLWKWSFVSTHIFELSGSFGEDCEDPEDDSRSARSSAAWNPEAVAEAYQGARARQMTRKVMEHKLHIKRETIRQIILEGSGNRQICMKSPPPFSRTRSSAVTVNRCVQMTAWWTSDTYLVHLTSRLPTFSTPYIEFAFKGETFQNVEDVKYNVSRRMTCSFFGLYDCFCAGFRKI
jgi:hypothetical protein